MSVKKKIGAIAVGSGTVVACSLIYLAKSGVNLVRQKVDKNGIFTDNKGKVYTKEELDERMDKCETLLQKTKQGFTLAKNLWDDEK